MRCHCMHGRYVVFLGRRHTAHRRRAAKSPENALPLQFQTNQNCNAFSGLSEPRRLRACRGCAAAPKTALAGHVSRGLSRRRVHRSLDDVILATGHLWRIRSYALVRDAQAPSPLKALVLDLRGNPGGLLSSAIKVSELFINEGDKIVTTRGRTVTNDNVPAASATAAAATPASSGGSDVVPSSKDSSKVTPISRPDGKGGVARSTFETTYRSDPIAMRIPNGQQQVVFHPPLLNPETRLVVLVNKYTASAAEIVSGAIQDHDRGVILGETTYGKGLVQQLQRLGQGGQQIKFTIGKYYTPSGRCIQSKAYTARNGQLGTDEVKVKDADRKVFYTDGGRQVRDGGGIEPDVEKKDPQIGQLERELDRKDMFFDYASLYEAKHLADGEKVAGEKEALATNEVYEDFQKWVLAKSEDVESPFDKSLDIMKQALEETGYTAALQEVETLKVKLQTLTKEEFKKNEKSIKKRLDLALRQRFVPDSVVTQVSLYGDDQVQMAYELVTDQNRYVNVLGTKKSAEKVATSGSPAIIKSSESAWDAFGN